MKFASAFARMALIVAIAVPATGVVESDAPDGHFRWESDPAEARDRSLASLTTMSTVIETGRGLVHEGSLNGGSVRRGMRGVARSLTCTPRFTDIFSSAPGPKIGIAPINASKLLMSTSAPGSGLPPLPRWYAPLTTTEPFYICNKRYKLAFPGMVGYTFRAFTNGLENGCLTNGTDFYVLFKLYNPVNKTVVKRQKEMSAPYVLYGNQYPLPTNSSDDALYGSTLLPNGVYQVSATLHAPNGTVVDETDFGTDIYVVSC